MKNATIEIKWTIFNDLSLDVDRKISGLRGTCIDYHFYLTNLFAIRAIWMTITALKDKKKISITDKCLTLKTWYPELFYLFLLY